MQKVKSNEDKGQTTLVSFKEWRLNAFGQEITDRKHSWGATDIIVRQYDYTVVAYRVAEPRQAVWEAIDLETMISDIENRKHIKI